MSLMTMHPTHLANAPTTPDAEAGEDSVPELMSEGEMNELHGRLPGIIQMIIPRTEDDRERTPRRHRTQLPERRPSVATTAPADEEEAETTRGRSPKRRTGAVEGERASQQRRMEEPSGPSSTSRPEDVMVPNHLDDELYVDVFIQDVIGELPTGWRCIEGQFEMADDVYYTAYRKGEVNMKKLDLSGQESYIEAKKTELAPTASRLARTMLLSVTSWLSWSLTCGDVEQLFFLARPLPES